jgi:16S rRNA (guanine527-N7)-methyltransferase
VTGAAAVARAAEQAHLVIDTRAAEQLASFTDLLLRWNASFNLVAKGDEDRLVHRHVIDSLTASSWLEGERVADLGTGAGLPGIPLAIINPTRHFALLDRSERRLRFVRQAIIELGLDNVTLTKTDIARYRPSTLFDTVVSRAVGEPTKLWRVAQPMLDAAGRAVFFCGPEATAPSDVDGVKQIQIDEVTLPGLERRHRLLVIDRA